MEKPEINITIKKSLLLLKVLILSCHDIDEEENKILSKSAISLNAEAELEWAKEFIYSDFPSSIQRTRLFLLEFLENESPEDKFYILSNVWKTSESKGFVTEIEAMTMLKIASDWGLVNQLLSLARNK